MIVLMQPQKAETAIRNFCAVPADILKTTRRLGFDSMWVTSVELRSVVNLLLQLPSDTRDVWSGHIVEYVSALVLSPQSVGALLRWCFV